jgi:UDP-glucose 4-epimerase
MSSSRRIAVVTGGAGFIGSHMVDLLVERGCGVRIIDNLVGGRESNIAHHASNPDVIFEESDIRAYQPGHSLFADADYVVHFAGIGDIVPSIERPLEYMSVNVQGTVHMLECARHAGIKKFVYAASSSCYGLAATPTSETHPIAPQYPYALSKYQGEQATFHWHKVYHLPVNAIRIFNAYGTRSRTSGAYGAVFGVFLKQKLAGQPFTVIGDGTQRRDFLYATDVAAAFLLAAESPIVGEIWNLGAGNPQSVNRLVELLGGPVVHIPKRPGEPDCTFADISKIKRELGWSQQVSFEEGVRRVLDNIEYWREAPLWTPDSIAKATAVWFNTLSSTQASS